MRINLLTPSLALVAIVFLFFGMYQCQTKKVAKLELAAAKQQVQQKDAEIQARIAQKDTVIKRTHQERVNDSLRYELKLGASQRVSEVWRKKALANRPAVLVLADSIPILKAYIQATDSLIESQDSTIALQRNHITAQATLYQVEISALGEKNVQQIALAELYKGEYIQQTKETAREQKRKRFWKGVAVVGTIVGFGVGVAISN